MIKHIQQSEVLATRKPKAAVAHVYFDYKHRARQTPENILAQLIKQLEFQKEYPSTITDMPPMPHIQPLYDRLHKQCKRPVFSELQGMLLSIGEGFDDVYLVFEALDECDETTRRTVFLPLITQLSGSLTREGKTRFKIFVTNRPNCVDIQNALEPRALKLPIIPDPADMELVARAKITVVRQKGIRISVQLEQDIVSAIVHSADGM